MIQREGRMAEIDVLKAQIVRESPSIAWGLTLQGTSPITIYRVSKKGRLRWEDLIVLSACFS